MSLRKLDFDPNNSSTGAIKGSVMDITALKATEQKLNYLSERDTLTNLYNRTQVIRQLKNLDKQQSHDCHFCFCLNIDHFSVINDSGGVGAGDQLLKTVSSLVTQQFQDAPMIARIGNDEFFILLNSSDTKQSMSRTQRMHQLLFPISFRYQQQLFSVHSSIGIAYKTESSQTTMDLLEQAIVACNTAKRQGGQQIHVYTTEPKQQQAFDGMSCVAFKLDALATTTPRTNKGWVPPESWGGD